jgi:hypothetical protein
MSRHYEGSVSVIGTEDWSEPHDVLAPTPEIAAQKVIKSHGESGEIEGDEEMDIAVREITVDGDPLSEWDYFRGKAWPVWRALVKTDFSGG